MWKPNGKALFEAVCKNDIGIVKVLLAEDSNLEFNRFGGVTAYTQAVLLGHVDICELLFRHGANVNARDAWGYTPCHVAIIERRIELVKICVSHGAVFDVPNVNGETPLDFARRWKHPQIVVYLTALLRVRYVCCFLIGIRKGTNVQGMGILGKCPKEIVRMIAHWVWVTRDDHEEWLAGNVLTKKPTN